MQVHIQNDGPVTLDIESPLLPPPKQVCVIITTLIDTSALHHTRSTLIQGSHQEKKHY